MSLQNMLSCTITFTKDVKSMSQLIAGNAEGWSVVDIQLDKLLQVNVRHIVSCFSILAKLHFIMYIFYLVKKKKKKKKKLLVKRSNVNIALGNFFILLAKIVFTIENNVTSFSHIVPLAQ